MARMNIKRWYTTVNRTMVTWATAVVNTAATSDIYEVRVTDGHEICLVWARTGQRVDPQRLARAKAQEQAGAVPAPYTPGGGRGKGIASKTQLAALTARVVTLEAKP